MNARNTDDLRIKEIREVVSPWQLLAEMPVSDAAADLTLRTRDEIHRILTGEDDRLLVISGPCSIHDVDAAREYAQSLRTVREELASELLVVMRVYFEKLVRRLVGRASSTIRAWIRASRSTEGCAWPGSC